MNGLVCGGAAPCGASTAWPEAAPSPGAASALGFLYVLGVCCYVLPVLSRGRSWNLYLGSHPSQQYPPPLLPPPHIPLVTYLIPDRDFVRMVHGKATYLDLVFFLPKMCLLAHSPRAEENMAFFSSITSFPTTSPALS